MTQPCVGPSSGKTYNEIFVREWIKRLVIFVPFTLHSTVPVKLK